MIQFVRPASLSGGTGGTGALDAMAVRAHNAQYTYRYRVAPLGREASIRFGSIPLVWLLEHNRALPSGSSVSSAHPQPPPPPSFAARLARYRYIPALGIGALKCAIKEKPARRSLVDGERAKAGDKVRDREKNARDRFSARSPRIFQGGLGAGRKLGKKAHPSCRGLPARKF